MGDQDGGAKRPWRPRVLLVSALVVVLVAATFATIGFGHLRAGASTGAVPLVGPRHELSIGTVQLTFQTANPLQATLVDEFYMWTSVYSGLIGIGPDLSRERDVAVRWQQTNPAQNIWDFWLAKNAYFIDPRTCSVDANGHRVGCATDHQVTAADVKFTWDYVYQYRFETAYYAASVENFIGATVDPLDPFHVTLQFDGDLTTAGVQPYAPALAAIISMPVLPQYIWQNLAPDDANALPIGSGPYMVRPDATGTRMVAPPPLILDRNPLWHGMEAVGRQVYPDTLQYVSYTSSGAMSIDLSLGKIDIALSPNAQDWTGFLATAPGVWRQQVPAGFVAEQAINVLADDLRTSLDTSRPIRFGDTNPTLRDHAVVREAIHMVTDRTKVMQAFNQGLATKGDTIFPPFNSWHYDYPDYQGPTYEHPDGDPATIEEEFLDSPEQNAAQTARQLLHDAGWLYSCGAGNPLDDGDDFPLCRAGGAEPLVFKFSTFNTPPEWEAWARVVVEDAKGAGIQFNLDLVNSATMNNYWYRLDYEVWAWDWVIGATSELYLLLEIQACFGINTLSNDNGFCPRDESGTWLFDEVWNQTRTETDPATRQELGNYLQRWLYEYASYNLPFYLNQLYAGNEIRWTHYGNWQQLIGLPPDVGVSPLIAQYPWPINQKPPQFDLATFEGVVNRDVQFSVAAIDPEGGPLKYRWDFDTSTEPGTGPAVNSDGIYDNDEQATTANPTSLYGAAGTYGIALRVSEDGGEYFTVDKSTVRVSPAGTPGPVITAVTFGPSDPVVTDASVDFAASAYDRAGAAITSYSWNFGDGSAPSTSPSPLASHKYNAADTYTVTLTVTSANGQTSSPTLVSVAANEAPSVASLESKAVVRSAVESYVAFASDPNARDILLYEWDFDNDGTIDATGNPVDYAYGSLGTFTQSVRVSDGHNPAVIQFATINVVPDRNGIPRIQSLTFSPSTVYTTTQVTFTGTVSDPEGNALRWDWDFNDDGTVDATETTDATAPDAVVTMSQTHQYTTPSPPAGYKARLTVTDIPAAGQTPKEQTTFTSVRVFPNAEPVASALGATPDTVIAGQDVAFEATASDPDGDPLSWVLNFGDGASASGSIPAGPGGTIQASHAYAAEGDFLTILVVTDGKGGEDRTSARSTVSLPALLRATTNPAVHGKIIVDGVARDEWGLAWMKIAPGPHTVSFGDVFGLGTAPSSNIDAVAGVTSEVVGNYARWGSLRVTTEPAVASTISVDGVPQNDWGMWRSIAPGTHTISFGAVAGFNPPADQVVTIAEGEFRHVNGLFTANPDALGPDPSTYGFLWVTTNPAVHSLISVNGAPRDEWGTFVKLAPGDYEVSFKGVYSFTPPAPRMVHVDAGGGTTFYQGDFLQHGSLRITTNPALAATIFVNGIPRNDWGMWQSMEPGTYKVSFGPYPGFITPAAQIVQVTAGGFTPVEGLYTPAPAAPVGSLLPSLESVVADLADGQLDMDLVPDSDGPEPFASASGRAPVTRNFRARSH